MSLKSMFKWSRRVEYEDINSRVNELWTDLQSRAMLRAKVATCVYMHFSDASTPARLLNSHGFP